MIKNKRLGILITDGVGYRNFIHSSFLRVASAQMESITIFSCIPLTAFNEVKFDNVNIVEIIEAKETFITWFFRKYKEVAHLQKNKVNNKGIQSNLQKNYSNSTSIRGIITRLIFFISNYFHSEEIIHLCQKFQEYSIFKNKVLKEYRLQLIQAKPEIIFVTHQRPPYIAPFIYVCKQLQLKTITFIFSWDNLSSKGRMASNFNFYFVWSELMKNELLKYYPKLKKDQIFIVGTPQFESYVNDDFASTKESFWRTYNLNQDLKTICYSCGDISTSKNDELYIETIANLISSNKIPEINFIVRTSPAEDGSRFSKLIVKYPDIKWNFPKWELVRSSHQESWSQRIPLKEDVKDLRALIEFSDLNINMLSTMSLDFMCFDKPVINPVFGNLENGLYNDQKFLFYEHIQNVIQSKSTKIVKSEEELTHAINMYLNDSSLDSVQRKSFLKLQIGKELNDCCQEMVENLLQI
ncbi:MAG: hypothetical protein ACK4JX_05980 [Flavobacterium sp.]